MATYSGTIDLRVTGNALKEVDLVAKRINEIRSLAKSLKPAPNLFDKRGNEKIVKAKEELRKLVNEYGKGTGAGKRFSNTLAGLNSQISAFGKIIGNVNVNSDEFVSAITAQEKASRRLARAEAERLKVQTRVNTANTVGRATSVQETLDLGKVVPKSIAGLELYQRELQETFRNVEIGTESYRDLRNEILRVNALMRDFEMNAPAPSSPIGGRADIPGSPAALAADRNARAQRRTQRRRDVLTGAGFPLLFGGGPVQALAGGIGGAFGGLGGSIAGSAIASQVEAFARAAAEAGVALTSTGGALDFMREKSLFSSEAAKERAAVLEELGQVEELAAHLGQEMAKAIGNNGVQALKDLGDTTKETTRLWNLLTTQLFRLVSGPLNSFLEAINRVLGQVTTGSSFNALLEDLAPDQRARAQARFEELRGRVGTGRSAAQSQTLTDTEAQKIVLKEFGGLQKAAATPLPITDEDRRRFDKKGKQGRRSRVPDLNAQIQLEERLLTLNNQIAEAKRNEDPLTASILQKEVVRERAAAKLAIIDAKRIPAVEKVLEKQLLELKTDQEILKIQNRLKDIRAAEAERVGDIVTDLQSEGALLRARLSGNEKEVALKQKVAEATKDMSAEDAKRVEDLIRANALLREQNEEMNRLKTKVDEIGATIKDGFVDGIQSAIDGSKTLGQVLSDMLNRLSNQLLQMGANQLFGSAQSGTGLLGSIAGLFNFGGGGGGGGGGGLNLDLVDAYMAKGGPVKGGGSYVVGERGPELFVPRSSGTIVPNNAMGGSTNVVVNVDAKGTAAQGDDAQAGQLGRLIGAAVQAELVRQKRPGGLLTR